MTMIRKRTGIAPLAISILLFAAFAASSGDESSNEIRDLLIPKDFNSNPQHKAMRELLERIAREHPDMDTKSLKEIIFQLGNKGFTERRLVLLLESRHYYGTIDTFKSIWATVHDGHHESSSYDAWRYYLKTIGGYLFFSSAEQIHKSFKAINPTKNIFFETDLVFYYTFSLDKASIKFGDDIERGLAPKLKSFDFINDDYDAIRMLGAIRMIMNHDWNAARGFGLFKQFMLQQCKKFQQDEKLTYMIECIDIAKYFGMNCSFDRAILLVRYKRLCSDLTKPDTSKLMEANFERQLKRKGSQGKCNSFWCLDRLIEIVAKPK